MSERTCRNCENYEEWLAPVDIILFGRIRKETRAWTRGCSLSEDDESAPVHLRPSSPDEDAAECRAWKAKQEAMHQDNVLQVGSNSVVISNVSGTVGNRSVVIQNLPSAPVAVAIGEGAFVGAGVCGAAIGAGASLRHGGGSFDGSVWENLPKHPGEPRKLEPPAIEVESVEAGGK